MKKKNSFISVLVSTMKLIYSYGSKYPNIIILLSIISTIMPFLSLINTQMIINGIQQSLGFDFIRPYLLYFILISLVSLIVNSLYNYYLTKFRDFLYLHINYSVLSKSKELSLVDFETSEVYDKFQRAETEAGIRPFSMFASVILMLSSFVTLISSIMILVVWKWWVLLGFLILPMIAFKKFQHVSKLEYEMIYSRSNYERKSWYIAHLLSKDTFIKEVKMLNLFEYLINAFKDLREKFYHDNVNINKKKIVASFVYQFSNLILSNIIVLVAILEAINAKILVGTLFTYINTTNKVDSAISSISTSIFNLYQDSLHIKNLLEFLDFEKEELKKEGLVVQNIETIELTNVSFKYPKRNDFALNNISFSVKKGEKIAIVGENGSGKTTIIKILCGLYTNYSGTIKINGIDLKDIDVESMKRITSVVFQDFNSYQFTINENIGFGDIDNLTDKEAIQIAADKSYASEFINLLPNRFSQQVGNWFPNGTQLSGGQWQRLALARAFMKESSLFILDEPTASLDPVAEFNFFKSVFKHSLDSVNIIITHRYSNAKIADKIIVFDKGNIACIGTHDELLKTNLLYKKMYRIGEFKKEDMSQNEDNTILHA